MTARRLTCLTFPGETQKCVWPNVTQGGFVVSGVFGLWISDIGYWVLGIGSLLGIGTWTGTKVYNAQIRCHFGYVLLLDGRVVTGGLCPICCYNRIRAKSGPNRIIYLLVIYNGRMCVEVSIW